MAYSDASGKITYLLLFVVGWSAPNIENMTFLCCRQLEIAVIRRSTEWLAESNFTNIFGRA